MESQISMHNIDVSDFMKTVDSCKGNVFLETNEGDCLNLKSKLSQLIGLTQLIEGGIISEATVRCELPEDETKLFRFNLYKQLPDDK